MQICGDWFVDNKLNVHFGDDKTKSILFVNKYKLKKTKKLEIIFNGIEIKQHSRVKYLGCILDETLSGDSMALSVLNKVNARLKILYMKNKFLTPSLRRLLCNALIQQILLPTRLTSRSKTLIDNIFVNHVNTATTSGNLTCTVSDHLPQFLVNHNDKYNIPGSHNIQIRNMKKFVEKDFIEDINKLDWVQLLDVDRGDLNHSFDTLISTINITLDKHAPFKKISKKELKLQNKPWISKGILCSIRKRDIIFRRLKKATNSIVKTNLHNKYKTYRNQIVILSRMSKKNYYSSFFHNNMGNLRKTWEGIREIVNLKGNSNSIPNCITNNGKNVTNPNDIADNFNSFFSSIGNKIQKEVFSQHKHFSDFLKNSSANSIFLTPTDPKEIATHISSLNIRKATGPNSIPNFILSKICKQISIPLSILINCSFETGNFPNNLKGG